MAAVGEGRGHVIKLIYLVGFLDLFGVSMLVPLLSRHARDLGASPTTVGIVGSMYGALQLFSSPLVGKWSDSSGRRNVLLWCLLLSGTGYFLLGLSTTIILLALARIPSGVFKHTQDLARGYLAHMTPTKEHSEVFGRLNAASQVGFIVGPLVGGHLTELPGGFYLVAMATCTTFLLIIGIFKHTQGLARLCLADMTPSHKHSLYLGRYNAISNMGFIMGPALGGHVADTAGGMSIIFMSVAFVFVLNTVVVYCFIPETTVQRVYQEKKNTKQAGFQPLHFIEDFKRIDWTNLWDIFLIRFLLGFAVLVFRSNFSLMLDYRFQLSAKTTGYITSFTAVIGTVSGFFVGRIAGYYKSDGKLLFHTGIVQLISLILLIIAPSVWVLILCLAPLSIVNAIARVVVTNLTIERGKGQETGTLLGLGASVLSVGRMLSPTAGGIAQEFHVSGPIIVGAIFALAGVTLMTVVKQDRPIAHWENSAVEKEN